MSRQARIPNNRLIPGAPAYCTRPPMNTDNPAEETVISNPVDCQNNPPPLQTLPHQLSKKQPPHLRAQNLKVHSPSDVLSPFSQKIIAERTNALKSLKPKSLKDTLLSVRHHAQLSQLRQETAESEDRKVDGSNEIQDLNNSANSSMIEDECDQSFHESLQEDETEPITDAYDE